MISFPGKPNTELGYSGINIISREGLFTSLCTSGLSDDVDLWFFYLSSGSEFNQKLKLYSYERIFQINQLCEHPIVDIIIGTSILGYYILFKVLVCKQRSSSFICTFPFAVLHY